MLHVRYAAILCALVRSSNAGNNELLCARHTLPAFWEQCSKYLWTICIPPDTIFVTPVETYVCMVESSGAKRG